MRKDALPKNKQPISCRKGSESCPPLLKNAAENEKSHTVSAVSALYESALSVIGENTPLLKDCGVLCGKACCKGDDSTGMRLFPMEETVFKVLRTADGGRLCVCSGTCDRKARPLGCRIFPLFPILHKDGHISAELDIRGYRVCPLAEHAENVRFSADFRKAVRRAGRILCRDAHIRKYIREVSEEIIQTAKLYGVTYRISKRK